MGKILKGSDPAASSEIKTEPSKKRLGKRKKEPSTSDSLQKNVRFDCNSAEKDHVKYITTPFLSSVKKEKAKNNKPQEKINNKKKLSFDEETSSDTKTLSKKRKLDSDENKTSESVVQKSSVPVTKQKKSKAKTSKSEAAKPETTTPEIIKQEAPESKATIENSATAPEAPEAPASNRVNEKQCTIFVGNLPLTYDHKKIVKLFNKFGPIESARIRCVPVASVNVPKKTTAITKKFNPKRSSANAYVVFKSVESVEKAVAENGMVVDGHHLRIDHVWKKKKDSKKSIFVGGLPFDVEDDDLWEAFKDCGEITDVRIVRDNVFGMGKGFGYVNFKSMASVELALKLNRSEIKNRKINVQRCLNKKKKSYEKFSKLKTKKKDKQKNAAKPKVGKELSGGDFQGRTAEKRKKKKKVKKTTDTLRRDKIKKVLSSSPKKVKKDKSKADKLN